MSAKAEVLNERAAILLKKLVYSYISDGQPIGSKRLAHDAGLDISSATIRNVLSVLEKRGLVKAPHTSAGRIPTERGFRMFVDSLLEVQPINRKLLLQLKKKLDPDQDRDTLINQASQMVSELTHMAGVITVPKVSESVLRHIEFLPLPGKKALAILVINEKEVQNRVIQLDREYTATQLQDVAGFMNQTFAGQDVYKIRQNLLSEMNRTRKDMDVMMQTAIKLADKALLDSESKYRPYRVQGEANLVKYGVGTDTTQLQHMLEMFDHKRDMLNLLDRCIQGEGVKIFIGKEVGIEGLGDCSVITAPYSLKGELLGVLGVVGPTRINYDKVIPVVDITARLLGEALSK